MVLSRRWVASLLIAAVFVICGAGALNSQPAPSVGDILSRQAGEIPPELTYTPEEPLSIQVMPLPETTADLGVTLQVRRFAIRNNTVFSTMVLNRLVAGWENRELTLGQVHEAAREITKFYQEAGYFLARAYVPAQEVRDGVVEIIVLEGRLGEVMVDGNEYYREGFIECHFIPVKYDVRSFHRGRTAINYAQLERSLLLLNDNLNLDARAIFRPGKEIYDTDLYLEVEDRRPFSGYLDYNNFGSRYISRHRFGLTVNAGNLLRQGDVTTLRTAVGVPLNQMFHGSIGYNAPVNWAGTRVGASYSYLSFDVTKAFKILDMEGRSSVYNLNVSHPVIRSQRRNLTVDAAFERKSVTNYIFGEYVTGDDVLSVVNAGLSFNNTDESGRNYLRAHVHQGIPDFLGSNIDPALGRGPAGATARFTKLTFDAGRIHRLNLEGLNRLAAMFTGDCGNYDERIGFAVLRAQGQWTNDTLPTAEQFSLGGPDTVRGYPMGDFPADRGFALGLEVRAPILRDRFPERVQLSLFTDYGRGYLVTALPDERKSDSLSGAGLGVRALLPFDINMRLDCAWRIGGIQPSDGHKPAVNIQLVKPF